MGLPKVQPVYELSERHSSRILQKSFWEALDGTKAFDIMSQMPGTTIGKSPFENYKEDISAAKDLMTKPCGN